MVRDLLNVSCGRVKEHEKDFVMCKKNETWAQTWVIYTLLVSCSKSKTFIANYTVIMQSSIHFFSSYEK